MTQATATASSPEVTTKQLGAELVLAIEAAWNASDETGQDDPDSVIRVMELCTELSNRMGATIAVKQMPIQAAALYMLALFIAQ